MGPGKQLPWLLRLMSRNMRQEWPRGRRWPQEAKRSSACQQECAVVSKPRSPGSGLSIGTRGACVATLHLDPLVFRRL